MLLPPESIKCTLLNSHLSLWVERAYFPAAVICHTPTWYIVSTTNCKRHLQAFTNLVIKRESSCCYDFRKYSNVKWLPECLFGKHTAVGRKSLVIIICVTFCCLAEPLKVDTSVACAFICSVKTGFWGRIHILENLFWLEKSKFPTPFS